MRKIFYCLILLILFFIAPYVFIKVEAASFSFDKTTATVNSGGTFQISVNLDPGSDKIYSADIYINYDANLLKPTAVSAGSLFPTVSNDISTSGKIYIAAMVNDPTAAISSSGTVATITFQALKDGSATLSFDCNSSKIIKDDANASNVLNCSANNSSTITIGTTASDNNNSSEIPTELPKTGILENVLKFAFPGIIFLILGGALRLVL